MLKTNTNTTTNNKTMNKLKDFLATEILMQKLRKNPDKHYIMMMQMMSDKEEFTKDNFVNTGRIMEKSYYLHEFVNHSRFNHEVKDIVRYAGGFCVQILPSGKFMFDTNDANEADEESTKYISEKLSDVENKMWEKQVLKRIK